MEEINNNYNDKLFFKVWRNIFLKDKILEHLKLYSYNYWPRIFSDCQSIKKRETKEYLNSIHLISFPKYYVNDLDFLNKSKFDDYTDASMSDSDDDYEIEKERHQPNPYVAIKKKEKYQISSLKNQRENHISKKNRKFSFKRSAINNINDDTSSSSFSDSDSGSDIQDNNFYSDDELYSKYDENPPFKDENVIKSILPFTLESIFIDFRRNSYFESPNCTIQNLPESVKYLKIGDLYKDWFINSYFQNGNGENLTSLNLGESFNQEITPNLLPPNLLELTIGSDFTKQLKPNTLPITLKYLYIGYSFNVEISQVGILPNSLTDLRLARYDRQFKGNLISSLNNLKKLILPSYNHTIAIGSLPQSLEYLTLGNSFKSQIKEGALPNNLKYLKIESNWKQEIQTKLLPKSLKTLKFKSYALDIINLPSNLKYLYCGELNNKALHKNNNLISLVKSKFGNDSGSDGQLPKTLQSFKSGSFNKIIYSNDFPNGLTNLDLRSFNQQLTPSTLPNTIKYLKLRDFNNGGKPLKKDCLPQQLMRLEFNLFNQPIESLPNQCLEVVYLGNNFNQSLAEGILPKTLKFLNISCHTYDKDIHLPNEIMVLKFSPPICDASKFNLSDSFFNKINDFRTFNLTLPIPPNCTKLSIPQVVSQKIPENSLPTSIRSIKLEDFPMGQIDSILANNIKYLTNLVELEVLDYKELLESNLPNTIQILKLTKKSTQLISPLVFPSLKEIHIKDDGCPIILNDDPTAFPYLDSIYVKISNTKFLDSIKQKNYFKYIKLFK
ncbi:hypothetical protein RB653_003830 [Dictyostelium firmibasis]|uniref:FNIP repeat-containing protein n=1 Tax=Dictyostelium firmibasis TaxID=79012 RepID=A0AAN7YZG7_9MYCE